MTLIAVFDLTLWIMRNLTFLFLLTVSFLCAQPNQQWYLDNDRGKHFEGSYTRKVSNPSISLVALTSPLPAYAFGEKQKLNIQFFAPEGSPYNLHAEELRITQFYWLEDKSKNARAGWNSFDNWQVDYLLRRFAIDHRNLGVLVRLGQKGNRKYLPARVQLEGRHANPTIYIAQLRLGRPASGGSFTLYRGQTKTAVRQIYQQSISKKSSGTVFPVVIPFDRLGSDPGWFTLELNLKEERTGDPFTYSFSFYHHSAE